MFIYISDITTKSKTLLNTDKISIIYDNSYLQQLVDANNIIKNLFEENNIDKDEVKSIVVLDTNGSLMFSNETVAELYNKIIYKST